MKLAFRYPGTRRFFKDYLAEVNETEYDLRISKEFMEENRWLVSPRTGKEALEYHTLMLAAGNRLLHVRRALFHGASFIWRDKAWIFTGFSGIGKTTQLRHWMEHFPDEIKLINGDKTALYCDPEGGVFAGSSPWEGKEHLGVPGREAGLGGIVVLEQGPENEICRIPEAEAVHPLFIEVISLPDTEQEICFQRDILGQVLDAVPVWKLRNRGDREAAFLARRTFEEYLEKKDEFI